MFARFFGSADPVPSILIDQKVAITIIRDVNEDEAIFDEKSIDLNLDQEPILNYDVNLNPPTTAKTTLISLCAKDETLNSVTFEFNNESVYDELPDSIKKILINPEFSGVINQYQLQCALANLPVLQEIKIVVDIFIGTMLAPQATINTACEFIVMIAIMSVKDKAIDLKISIPHYIASEPAEYNEDHNWIVVNGDTNPYNIINCTSAEEKLISDLFFGVGITIKCSMDLGIACFLISKGIYYKILANAILKYLYRDTETLVYSRIIYSDCSAINSTCTFGLMTKTIGTKSIIKHIDINKYPKFNLSHNYIKLNIYPYLSLLINNQQEFADIIIKKTFE